MNPKRIEPGPGQESVWDYPRPPRIDPSTKHIQVFFQGRRIADTRRAKRVLETASPPVFYIPPADVALDFLQPVAGYTTVCEWKGRASYYTVVVGREKAVRAAWTYHAPFPPFRDIQDYLAFYAQLMDRCLVDGEEVRPQPGLFYGGWITSDIVGPYKGDPGTGFW
jgi:uncharacterized protein (DUF427 family)